MKPLFFSFAFALLLLCGCQSVKQDEWILPPGFDPMHSMDRILIQIEEPTVSQGYTVDPAIVTKLKTFLFDKFNASARFVILNGTQGDLKGTQNIVLKILPVLGYHRKPMDLANIYYCQTSISCRFLDLETGAASNNGADDFSISKNCQRPIVVRKIYGQEHIDISATDVDTMFNESFMPVWQELEEKIAEKFPANAKIKSVLSVGSATKLSIDEGVANGFHNGDILLIYAVNKDHIVTVVALASGQIGKSGSTLNVIGWNMDDPVVRTIYYPQMQNNNAENLYVVAKQRKRNR